MNCYNNEYIEAYTNQRFYYVNCNEGPSMPPIPPDELPIIPPKPIIVNVRNSTMLSYATSEFVNLETDPITGKPVTIVVLSAGNATLFIATSDQVNEDSLFLEDKKDIISVLIPEDVFIEKISATLTPPSALDFEDVIFTAKIRLYRADYDKTNYEYIEGAEIVFKPDLTGKVTQENFYLAESENLNIAVAKNSKLAIGAFAVSQGNENGFIINGEIKASIVIANIEKIEIPVNKKTIY